MAEGILVKNAVKVGAKGAAIGADAAVGLARV